MKFLAILSDGTHPFNLFIELERLNKVERVAPNFAYFYKYSEQEKDQIIGECFIRGIPIHLLTFPKEHDINLMIDVDVMLVPDVYKIPKEQIDQLAREMKNELENKFS